MNPAAGTDDPSPGTDDPSLDGPIILFDGVCNLCAGAVRFIIPRDRRGRFRFAALQSGTGQRMLAEAGIEAAEPGEAPGSLVLVADGKAYLRSAAALRIARGLDRAWPLASALLLIPTPLRDLAYRFVARNRYRWFGRHTACEVPRTTERGRFLDVEELHGMP